MKQLKHSDYMELIFVISSCNDKCIAVLRALGLSMAVFQVVGEETFLQCVLIYIGSSCATRVNLTLGFAIIETVLLLQFVIVKKFAITNSLYK